MNKTELIDKISAHTGMATKDVEKCLNMMIKNGTVLEFETVHKYNKKKVKRYKMK